MGDNTKISRRKKLYNTFLKEDAQILVPLLITSICAIIASWRWQKKDYFDAVGLAGFTLGVSVFTFGIPEVASILPIATRFVKGFAVGMCLIATVSMLFMLWKKYETPQGTALLTILAFTTSFMGYFLGRTLNSLWVFFFSG